MLFCLDKKYKCVSFIVHYKGLILSLKDVMPVSFDQKCLQWILLPYNIWNTAKLSYP